MHRLVCFFMFAFFSVLIFNSCGEDKVTNNTNNNSDCGTHHSVHYGEFNYSQYTNTYLENGIRVFQFSAIPLSSIGNICTHGKPHATGNANWLQGDTSRPFLIKVVVNPAVGFTPYTSTGTYTPQPNGYDWTGDINVGLEQFYGAGPGEIVDFRVEVHFRSYGTEDLDRALMQSRDIRCDMQLEYDEYRAP